MIYFHTQRQNLFYIGLDKNIILNQRDLVIYWPLGWKNASLRHISAIKSSDDQVTTNPVAINDIFKGFYTNLYKAETDFDEPICKQYLDKLELPRISQMDKES